MKFKEIIPIVIAGLALLVSLTSRCDSVKHNKRILRLEQVKLYSELGTLEDIIRKKGFLKIEHEEKRSAIFSKWTKIQSESTAVYSKRGLFNSGFFEQMKRDIETDRNRELTAEDRDFQDRLRDLESREKLIQDNVAKSIK